MRFQRIVRVPYKAHGLRPPICSKAVRIAARSHPRPNKIRWPSRGAPSGSATARLKHDPGIFARGIERLHRAAFHARALQVHDEERDRPGLSGRGPATTRMVGNAAVGDRHLGPFQQAAGDDRVYRVRLARAFHIRQMCRSYRQRRSAAGISPFCASLARGFEKLREEIDRRGERNGRDRTAEFFGDHAELEIAQAQPAIGFRNRRAGITLAR